MKNFAGTPIKMTTKTVYTICRTIGPAPFSAWVVSCSIKLPIHISITAAAIADKIPTIIQPL
ncbi:hypothetical protein D3C81_2059600 [compost metagenome]